MDRDSQARTRSNFINDLLFSSLATEEDMGLRKLLEKYKESKY
jgi:hypothetical protein